MKKTRFLWVDDEIELMKPYRLFLEERHTVEHAQQREQGAAEQRDDDVELLDLRVERDHPGLPSVRGER